MENETPAPPDYDENLHLVYDTEEEAIAAGAALSQEMGFTGSVTIRWDIPRQCSDGRWIFAKP